MTQSAQALPPSILQSERGSASRGQLDYGRKAISCTGAMDEEMDGLVGVTFNLYKTELDGWKLDQESNRYTRAEYERKQTELRSRVAEISNNENERVDTIVRYADNVFRELQGIPAISSQTMWVVGHFGINPMDLRRAEKALKKEAENIRKQKESLENLYRRCREQSRRTAACIRGDNPLKEDSWFDRVSSWWTTRTAKDDVPPQSDRVRNHVEKTVERFAGQRMDAVAEDSTVPSFDRCVAFLLARDDEGKNSISGGNRLLTRASPHPEPLKLSGNTPPPTPEENDFFVIVENDPKIPWKEANTQLERFVSSSIPFGCAIKKEISFAKTVCIEIKNLIDPYIKKRRSAQLITAVEVDSTKRLLDGCIKQYRELRDSCEKNKKDFSLMNGLYRDLLPLQVSSPQDLETIEALNFPVADIRTVQKTLKLAGEEVKLREGLIVDQSSQVDLVAKALEDALQVVDVKEETTRYWPSWNSQPEYPRLKARIQEQEKIEEDL